MLNRAITEPYKRFALPESLKKFANIASAATFTAHVLWANCLWDLTPFLRFCSVGYL